MRFALTAVDSANQVVAVDVDAADETVAGEVARQRGYSVLSIRRRGMSLPRNRAFPTTLFTIELLALLDAGLNVVEALQALAENEAHGDNRRILADILEALYRGESFSQALAHAPESFSALYIATVRSSERTGDVREALSRYVAYREELDRVRKKLVSALIYPTILVSVGALVLGFLMMYVVPRFARVYEEISADLPLFSSALLLVGRWVEDHRALVGVCAVALAAAGAHLLSRAKYRSALLRFLGRIPSLGRRMRLYQLGRFYRTAAMLLRAGIPALQTFQMVGALLPEHMRAQLDQAIGQLQEGRPMSAALDSAGLTTPIAVRMMSVGEKSGQMGELMDRIARFYDDDTTRFVDASTRVFEPVLMALLGLAVGAVVVLMYMPIFELAGSIK